MTDLGIGVRDANSELGTLSSPFSDTCISILLIPEFGRIFLFASSFSSGLEGGVMGFACDIE